MGYNYKSLFRKEKLVDVKLKDLIQILIEKVFLKKYGRKCKENTSQ